MSSVSFIPYGKHYQTLRISDQSESDLLIRSEEPLEYNMKMRCQNT